MNTVLKTTRTTLGALLSAIALASTASASAAPNDSKPQTTTGSLQTAVFAGGCFWGVDAVFRHVKGVSEVESGYAGGQAATAHYEQVSTGATGHAEAVRIRFDPTRISYPQLLQVFFSVAHDPTQLNRQGPDVGSQYRSAIFYVDPEQEKAALAYIQQLKAAQVFARPIVTEVVPLQQFHPAEAYHQNYLALHPRQPYIVFNDLPKLENLHKQFPAFYQ
jgi:peptide-methionine (S)-S-oxide reductase